VVADSDTEARRLFTSIQQQFANLVRGTRGQLPPPIDDIDAYWSPLERAQAQRMLACSFVGNPETVRRQLDDFINQPAADELILAAAIWDHQARLRSYERLARIADEANLSSRQG
jgi:alkanesulfonate monooxygenase SsuD/methylene tetrahydromethanopterin reductase-like flavin-dependent oxidoreductase (luciferase family)